MTSSLVDQIVEAVLYEGYILYPYRPSIKNAQRWTFGGVYPPSFSEVRAGSEVSSRGVECLVAADASAKIEVRIRFLQLVERRLGKLAQPTASPLVDLPADVEYVDALEVGGHRYSAWQEAVERQVVVNDLRADDLCGHPRETSFCFPSEREWESVTEADGRVAAVLVRDKADIAGLVTLSAEQLDASLFRLTLRVDNRSSLEDLSNDDRQAAQLRSFASLHVVLSVAEGEFVSLIDPPAQYREVAASCHNGGLWPVLVGETQDGRTLLCAPIILYDYPQIAPTSPQSLFDSTEIDEILTLRIMTLTEEEKQAMSGLDWRTRQLLERAEALSSDQMAALHGATRTTEAGRGIE